MPELNTDSDKFVRDELRFKVSSKKHYMPDGKHVSALTVLRVAVAGWQQQHIIWEALKKEAKRHGVNVGLFNRRLGKQYDELIAACREAEKMKQEFGVKFRTSGLLQRLQRLRATLDAYVALCRQHASKQKRTEHEAMIWNTLARHLEGLKEATKREEEQIKKLNA